MTASYVRVTLSSVACSSPTLFGITSRAHERGIEPLSRAKPDLFRTRSAPNYIADDHLLEK